METKKIQKNSLYGNMKTPLYKIEARKLLVKFMTFMIIVYGLFFIVANYFDWDLWFHIVAIWVAFVTVSMVLIEDLKDIIKMYGDFTDEKTGDE